MPPVIGGSTQNTVTYGNGWSIYGSGFPAEFSEVLVSRRLSDSSVYQMQYNVWFADPTNQIVIGSSSWVNSGVPAPPSGGSENYELYFANSSDLSTPLSNQFDFALRAIDWVAPSISGIAPNPVVNGNQVAISGTNLGTGAGAVRFVDALLDQYQLNVVSWTDTQVVVDGGWPLPIAPETGQVSLFRASDNLQTNTLSLTVNPAPPTPPTPPPITWSGGAASVQGDALRITQLDAAGAPTAETYTMSGFVSIKFTPIYGGGDLVGSRTANGLPGRRVRMPLVITKVNLELTLCSPSIRAFYELQGGKLKITNNYGSGYAAPQTTVLPCRDIAVEVWTKAIDASGSHIGYYRWLIPYVNMSFTGDTTVDEGTSIGPVFAGFGRQNKSFGAGADGFWIDQSGRTYQFAWDSQLPPDIE